VPGHELERVEGEGEKQLAVGEEEQGVRGLGRERDELPDLEHQSPPGLCPLSVGVSVSSPADCFSGCPFLMRRHQPDNLRLAALSALELSRSLQAQHASALSMISFLETTVNALESLVRTSQAPTQSRVGGVAEATQEHASLTTLVNEWEKDVEGQWGGVQESRTCAPCSSARS
jgi:hypothetical protein